MITRLRTVFADRDRGAAPVEMAIIGLPALALIGLLVIGGRVAIASSSISGVAGDAARDASIARSAPQAIQLAQSSAIASLQAQHLHCAGTPDVVVDTTGFSAPPGTPATIKVDVTCVVSLNDIGMPGLPGSRSLHDRGTSPLDPFRSIGLGFSFAEAGSGANRSAGVCA